MNFESFQNAPSNLELAIRVNDSFNPSLSDIRAE